MASNTIKATLGRSSGKYYFEVLVIATGTDPRIGIATDSAGTSGYLLGDDIESWAIQSNGFFKHGGALGAGAITWGINDVISIAVDLDLGRVWYGVNGVWSNGDPSTNTTPTYTDTDISNNDIFPAVTISDSPSGELFGIFAEDDFYYSLPTEFNAWEDEEGIEEVGFLFTLPYSYDTGVDIEHDFTLPYSYDQGVDVDLEFTLSYELEELILTIFEPPFLFEFTTYYSLASEYTFKLPYQIEGVILDEHIFRCKYKIDRGFDNIQFTLRYKSNIIPVESLNFFTCSYKIEKTKQEDISFNLSYRNSFLSNNTVDVLFRLPYTYYKQKFNEEDFTFRYKVQKYTETEIILPIVYNLRFVELQTIVNQDIVDNGNGGKDLMVQLDPTLFNTGHYHILIDNGNRYLKYILETNIGHDASKKTVDITYDASIDVTPLYTPANTEEIHTVGSVDNFNGYYGWENMSVEDITPNSGTLVFSESLISKHGETPYSIDRRSVDLALSGGPYIFDLDITGTSITPVLYLIDTLNNRVIRASEYNSELMETRIIVNLPVGTYKLVPTVKEIGPASGNSFSITAYGPEYNPIPNYNFGFSLGGDIDPIYNYSINEFNIVAKNIDETSSISLTLLDHNFNVVSGSWNSIIPNALIDSPEISYIISERYKFKIPFVDNCCFTRKVTIDPLDRVCRLPETNNDEVYTVVYVDNVEPNLAS